MQHTCTGALDTCTGSYGLTDRFAIIIECECDAVRAGLGRQLARLPSSWSVGPQPHACLAADAPSSGHSCLQDVIGGWPAAAAAAHASAESCAWAVVAHDQSTTAAAAALRSAAVIVPECDHFEFRVQC